MPEDGPEVDVLIRRLRLAEQALKTERHPRPYLITQTED